MRLLPPACRLAAMLLPMVSVWACGGGSQDTRTTPGPDFRQDTDVSFTGFINGDTVQSPFLLGYQAGSDVADVRLDLDGDAFLDLTAVPQDGAGQFAITLDPGRYRFTVVGLNGDGAQLSDYSISLRVAEADQPWVSIVSPSDGALVQNPVSFVVSASDDVDAVTLSADGWDLGTLAPGDILSYEFSGTGYARDVQADAYDSAGALLASDTISLTVDPGTNPVDSDFNATVLKMLATYPTDGSYGYYWPSDSDWAGTTQDIRYRDTLVAQGDPEHRSYCSGITWETFMRAWTQIDLQTGGDGTLNGMTVDDLYDFRTDWYVRDLWGDGVGLAVENYGIGERVTDWADVRPGDYVQIWRYSGSGHTFVFIDWLTDDDGAITGLRYWSSQGSTDGIAYNDEDFGSGGSDIDPNYFFVARVYTPDNWVPWF
ncbi:MAG: hypothetical protein GXP62_01620 [Oligoflexia bacterium]|nr:hypothetical protein [Oligoflexia bacterium]